MVNNRENRGQIQGKRDLVRDRAMFGIRDKSETVEFAHDVILASFYKNVVKLCVRKPQGNHNNCGHDPNVLKNDIVGNLCLLT